MSRRRTPRLRKLFGGSLGQLTVKEPIGFYNDSKYVQELVGNNFDNGVLTDLKFSNSPSIVMWYADWCPHCSNAETIKMWNDLGKFCHPDVNVCAINCANSFDGNDEVSKSVGIQGFPTISYVDPRGVVSSKFYSGQRDKSGIVKFLCSNLSKPGQIRICK